MREEGAVAGAVAVAVAVGSWQWQQGVAGSKQAKRQGWVQNLIMKFWQIRETG